MKRRWLVAPLLPTAAIVVVGAGPTHAVQYLTVEQAQRLCFADATAFEPADVTLAREQMRAIEKDSRVNVREATEKVWRVLNGATFLGWFIEDEVVGKQEFITWALALNADGTVRQIEILDYRETYGHEIRDPKWRLAPLSLSVEARAWARRRPPARALVAAPPRRVRVRGDLDVRVSLGDARRPGLVDPASRSLRPGARGRRGVARAERISAL